MAEPSPHGHSHAEGEPAHDHPPAPSPRRVWAGSTPGVTPKVAAAPANGADDHEHDERGGHAHDHGPGEHGHTHGAIDPSLYATQQGIRAVQISFAGMLATALFQLVLVGITGSVALLADTIHNLGDALTAAPLWAAFAIGRMRPSKRFTYGFGRAEDLAGVVVVLIILLSAAEAAWESVNRLMNPQPVNHLWIVAAAGLIGFAGNELVAWYRIRVGKAIGSAALVADGYHARADGFTSLAVVGGAAGVGLGFPLADPIIGLLITAFILKIVWEAGGQVLGRMMDGVDPEVVDEIRTAITEAPGVQEVSEVRVRWIGHRLFAEVNLAVAPSLTVAEAHVIAAEAEHHVLHRLSYLSAATIHVDPADASGEAYHRPGEHQHDTEPLHQH